MGTNGNGVEMTEARRIGIAGAGAVAFGTAALLDAIEFNTENKSGEELLRALAAKINYPDADALVAHGADALREMRELEILTGTRAQP